MHSTPAPRHGRSQTSTLPGDAPQSGTPVAVQGAILLLMLAWGGIIATGLGLY